MPAKWLKMRTELRGGHLDHAKLGSEQIKMLASLRKTAVNVALTSGAGQRCRGRWHKRGGAGPLEEKVLQNIPVEGIMEPTRSPEAQGGLRGEGMGIFFFLLLNQEQSLRALEGQSEESRQEMTPL